MYVVGHFVPGSTYRRSVYTYTLSVEQYDLINRNTDSSLVNQIYNYMELLLS
jgi:hypothetical protein